ncbi:MATE family efflux transporter [Clostridium sp. DL1XJH146]
MNNKVASKRDLIINGNIYKAIFVVSFPLMINSFINASYNFIDTLFVSQIGSIELATVALIGPIYNMLVSVGAGLSVTGTALIGKNVGRKDYNKVNSIVMHLLLICTFLGLFLTVFLWINSITVLELCNATEAIISCGSIYFKIFFLSIPFMLYNSTYIAVKTGYGETADVMKIHVVSMIIKVALTYYFVMQLDKGIEYLAISTLVGNLIIFLYGVYDFLIKKNQLVINLKTFKFDFKLMKKILIISFPVIIEKTSVSYSFVMINGNVLKFGETVLAAYGITNRINSLFFSTLGGLGSGLATIISQNIGAKNHNRIKKSIKSASIFGIAMSIIFASIIFFSKDTFASLLTNDDTVLYRHVINAISVYSISVIPWSIFQIVIGVFMGCAKTKYNLIISLVRLYLLRLPCIVILSQFASLNEYSIWYAMLISNVLTAIFAYIFYKIRINKILMMEKVVS